MRARPKRPSTTAMLLVVCAVSACDPAPSGYYLQSGADVDIGFQFSKLRGSIPPYTLWTAASVFLYPPGEPLYTTEVRAQSSILYPDFNTALLDNVSRVVGSMSGTFTDVDQDGEPENLAVTLAIGSDVRTLSVASRPEILYDPYKCWQSFEPRCHFAFGDPQCEIVPADGGRYDIVVVVPFRNEIPYFDYLGYQFLRADGSLSLRHIVDWPGSQSDPEGEVRAELIGSAKDGTMRLALTAYAVPADATSLELYVRNPYGTKDSNYARCALRSAGSASRPPV